ncbi:MAG: palindromic element RPE4 domain-containing protein [Rickettsia endosymbiont of Ecitomorpha arachnoides]|nr:palindromic element RPE4 domain-containing protein [Rickettsia endosymbiont of Sceptobius lativentris]MCC8461838.1 palindromic element RPE4 domain-containing protein [Rickettsia endosymbiont of Ecitomorpha arachnoides]
MSSRGLTTGSKKTIKNTNILIFLTGSRGQATG